MPRDTPRHPGSERNARDGAGRPVPRRVASALIALGVWAGASPAVHTAEPLYEPPVMLVTAPDPKPSSLAVLRWNLEARNLVRRSRADPLWAARTYAMVSLAQHRATQAFADDAPAPLVSAAVAASAATVLAHLYPHEVPQLDGLLQIELQRSATGMPAAQHAAAVATGIAAAQGLVQERRDDGAASLSLAAPAAATAGRWRSSEQWPPLRADWGAVRPFLGAEVLAIRAPPPPAPDTTRFEAALALVRRARTEISAANEDIARKWAGGPGSVTPPGYWNAIAAQLVTAHGLGEREAAHVLAVMNLAQADASIVCWRDKFAYGLLRPVQADPRLVTSFATPNFPSYPSGHAAFSGAAAAVLAHFFPHARAQVERLAGEAARSRVVSGLHYPFDSDAGLAQGRRVAALAIARFATGPSPVVPALPAPRDATSSRSDP